MTEAAQVASPVAQFELLGEGVVYDVARAVLTLPADPERSKIEAVIDIPATADRPRRKFLVSVAEAPVDATVTTVFAAAEDLGRVAFVGYVPPRWTLEDGFARMVLEGGSRAHGDWAGARGDGLYRGLLRWSGADLPYSLDRRFSFGARIQRIGSTWSGVRVDAYMTSSGSPRLQLRDYTGAGGATAALATAEATWAYDAWHWLDVAVFGTSVRVRIYPEAAAAPAWQIAGTTGQTGPGAFGPGGFPAGGLSPVIDVARLEYHPDAD